MLKDFDMSQLRDTSFMGECSYLRRVWADGLSLKLLFHVCDNHLNDFWCNPVTFYSLNGSF